MFAIHFACLLFTFSALINNNFETIKFVHTNIGINQLIWFNDMINYIISHPILINTFRPKTG